MHTTVTDGRDDIETMAAAAQRLGYSYVAITDHSKALAMSNGLDEHRALEHAGRIRALNGRFEGLTLLAGIECDVLADGTLDLADDCLAQLDIVIASVHAHYTQGETQTTERILRALECPWVDVLGHPLSRRLLQREPLKFNFDQVVSAAVAARCRARNQLPAGAARFERLVCTDGSRTGRDDRDFNRRAFSHGARQRAVGYPGRPTRLVDAGGLLNTRPVEDMQRLLRRNRRSTPDADVNVG